jgi:4-hydroxyphenylacetate 3-monooxygenase
MGACTGVDYLGRLRDDREVWYRGERVGDVSSHPALARGARAIAQLYDRQQREDKRELLTFEQDGERFGMSFLTPRSVDDVSRRGAAFYDWASWSGGMLGRTPDYLSGSFMAFAAAAEFFGSARDEFATNVRNYFALIRGNDLALTHTLVNPSFNRAVTDAGKASEEVALHVVNETDAGLVVSGARLLATLGPLSDEIAVFPSTVLKADASSRAFAFGFAIPNATPGLKFVCRDGYDLGQPLFDQPLSGRFDEMDCLVLFDSVLVPWERVFLYDSPEQCNRAYAETNAVVHMMHQVCAKNVAKAEFLVGLLCAMCQASGMDKDIHIQGQIAEAMWAAESMRAFLFQAERRAEQDRWGVWVPERRPLDTARNLFPRLYPRLIEIVQQLGASSLMLTPSAADFDSPIGPDLERYLALLNLEARDRVALFRLAQELAVNGFGGRQELYERFFFGPPQLVAATYYQLYDKDACIERVQELLARAS